MYVCKKPVKSMPLFQKYLTPITQYLMVFLRSKIVLISCCSTVFPRWIPSLCIKNVYFSMP